MLVLQRDPRGRPELPLNALPRMIEYRLHRVPDRGQVLAGCAQAARLKVAAVSCRPEHVAAAAELLHGSGVGVSSAVEFHDQPGQPLDAQAVIGQAQQLADAGATDVAIMASAGRVCDLDRQAGLAGSAEAVDANRTTRQASSTLAGFSAVVADLVTALEPMDVRVRVHLDDSSLSHEQVSRAAAAVQQAGAWMVQVGTWRQDGAGFGAVQAAREVLDSSVLLKWTTPVRSLPTLLFAAGHGVDRFNALDVPLLLAEARRSAAAGPLTVPVAGLDY